jgi:cbb3-type cytochrome oxidase maturation protein
MQIIIVLVAISLTIALIFLGIFFWNIRSGQYEDTYTPSVRMLFDDESKRDEKESVQSNTIKPGHDNLPEPRNAT